MLDCVVENLEIVAGDSSVHMMLDVEIHVPSKENHKRLAQVTSERLT